MAEANPIVTSFSASAPPPPEEPQIYRPVSILAITGLVMAGIYVALVVIVAAMSFFQATPVFLPGWTLLLAVAAAGLSLLGQWQIRESEGTRAGLALARWGLVLSIFAGLGYAAFQYFTGLALIQQANDFLMVREDADSGFFPRLESGDPVEINRAFLLTMPENIRSAIDPANTVKMEQVFNRGRSPKDPEGPLSKFRENFLVRSLVRHGQDAKIEVMGVQKWGFEKGSYIVTRAYRLSLPEMTVSMVLPVHSTEGDQRRWFLAFPQMEHQKADLTPLGTALVNAGYKARTFIERTAAQTPWNTLTDKTSWQTVIEDEPWQPIRAHIARIFAKGSENTHRVEAPLPRTPERAIPPWEVVNQRLRLTLDFKYTFQDPSGSPWMGNGIAVVEEQKPVSLDTAGRPDPQSLAYDQDWKIVSIEFQHLISMHKMMEKKMQPPPR